MFINENYDYDINYTYQLNRVICSILGIWPYAQVNFSLFHKLQSAALFLVFNLLLCCDVISTVLYMYMVQKETKGAKIKIVKVMSSLLITILSILKYGNMWYVKNQMRDCMVCMEKDFQNVSPMARNTMMFHVRTSRRLLILSCIFMYSAGLTFRVLLPLSRGKIITAQNITIRSLPSPAYYVVFDPQISPAYEIVFFVQCFTGFIRYTIALAGCGTAALFTMHIVAQLDILITLMNNLTIENENKDVDKKLSVIVQHQIKTRNWNSVSYNTLLRSILYCTVYIWSFSDNEIYIYFTMVSSFLQMIHGVLHFSSLVELMMCTSIMCIIVYCFIMEWENNNAIAICTYFIMTTSVIFNIFVYCYIGEQLSGKGEQVALTACTLDWHLLPDAKARTLILVMLMSNKPMNLRAGNFLELSFRTFGTVIKTALGYLNLLRSVVD